MSDSQLYSWIFLSIAIQTEPANFQAISDVADGIGHAVPTHKELQNSVAWLSNNGIIQKNAQRYSLTEKGRVIYERTNSISNTMMGAWNELEKEISLIVSTIR